MVCSLIYLISGHIIPESGSKEYLFGLLAGSEGKAYLTIKAKYYASYAMSCYNVPLCEEIQLYCCPWQQVSMWILASEW